MKTLVTYPIGMRVGEIKIRLKPRMKGKEVVCRFAVHQVGSLPFASAPPSDSNGSTHSGFWLGAKGDWLWPAPWRQAPDFVNYS